MHICMHKLGKHVHQFPCLPPKTAPQKYKWRMGRNYGGNAEGSNEIKAEILSGQYLRRPQRETLSKFKTILILSFQLFP